MNRRTYLSIFGTVGVSAAGLSLAYLLDRGIIDLGEEADVSETVSRGSDEFEFEAADGDDIYVTIRDTQDEPYRGAFTLYDPAGKEVLRDSVGTVAERSRTHTANQEGTYRLVVDSRGSSVSVSVLIQEPDE